MPVRLKSSAAVIKMTVAFGCGKVLYGRSVGASGLAVGEIVFNTSVTGYQETITDPSYLDQIVLFTFPHIGNSGINQQDMESKGSQPAGIITRCFNSATSGLRLEGSLRRLCRTSGLLVVTGIDTRELTATIRNSRKMRVCLLTDNNLKILPAEVAKASGHDASAHNLTPKASTFLPQLWFCKEGYVQLNCLRILVIDLGAKLNIFRNVIRRGCDVIEVGSYAKLTQLLQLQISGILLTNGPGDPRTIRNVVTNFKRIQASPLPTLGICLGHQIICLSFGSKVGRLMPGHHGTNHPVKDLKEGRVLVTSQNHNYSIGLTKAVDGMRVSHISLFDGSVQGIETYRHPVAGFQGHPEACPGPKDAEHLFDNFINPMLMRSVCFDA
ncbi:carbamoyl phosphate synthase small subunit [Candidatus Tremblaya phenacola PAVE]|nr:carbamoyl phosphate synthase small subunit [Candidatus Tremblaya phenacola PAVE]